MILYVAVVILYLLFFVSSFVAKMKMNVASSLVFVKMVAVSTLLGVTDVNVMKGSSQAHQELNALVRKFMFAHILLNEYIITDVFANLDLCYLFAKAK